MTIKLVTYLWAIATALALGFLFIYVPLSILITFLRGERFEARRTYSYRKVLKFHIISAIVFLFISALIFLETKSIELSLTFFVFFLACVISGMLRTLKIESDIKNRGGVKEK